MAAAPCLMALALARAYTVARAAASRRVAGRGENDVTRRAQRARAALEPAATTSAVPETPMT